MTAMIQPPIWNSHDDAIAGLAPLLGSTSVVECVLVKLDRTNTHHDGGPVYRQAKYAGAELGAIWYDTRTGLQLYNVAAWQLAE